MNDTIMNDLEQELELSSMSSQTSSDWDDSDICSTDEDDDDDDDEEGLAERTEICRLAQPLFPGKDIKVRMNYNDNYCQAVIEVKKTNDSLMTGEEKPTMDAAYRDLWEMVREFRRKQGLSDDY